MAIVELSTGHIQVRWRNSDGQQRKQTFSNEKLAQSFENKINLEKEAEEIHGKVNGRDIKLTKLVQEHRDQKQKKESSKVRDDYALKPIMAFLKNSRVEYAKDLSKQHIKLYEEHALKTPRDQANQLNRNAKVPSQRTVNIEIITLQAVLNHAVDNDRILYSSIKTFKKTKITKVEERFLYPDEIDALFHHCKTQSDKDLIYTILTMGLRIGEAINLQKSDFKNDIVSIRIKPHWRPKWDKERKISIDKDYCNDSRIIDIFQNPIDNSDFVFINKNGDQLKSSSTRNKFDRLCVRSGIEKPEEITLHTLRHTHISYAVARGINLRTIMDNVGINSYDVLLNYSHTVRGLDKNIPDKTKFPWQ